MNTYTIYLNDHIVARVTSESAYPCFEAIKGFATLINQPVSMVWDETREEVAFFDPEQEEEK